MYIFVPGTLPKRLWKFFSTPIGGLDPQASSGYAYESNSVKAAKAESIVD